MWKNYTVTLSIQGRLAASLPKTEDEIKKMLLNRMPAKPPENFVPIDELAEKVSDKVEAEEEPKFGWATFPRNGHGLYYEGRCVRGHIKDCAQQLKEVLGVTALKAKVANKVYIMTDIIPLNTNEPAGTETRFIQVMTRMGPRSTIKYIDYVENPQLVFQVKILDDGIITFDILDAIFEYGSVHGIGQERSQGWGRYTYKIEELK